MTRDVGITDLAHTQRYCKKKAPPVPFSAVYAPYAQRNNGFRAGIISTIPRPHSAPLPPHNADEKIMIFFVVFALPRDSNRRDRVPPPKFFDVVYFHFCGSFNFSQQPEAAYRPQGVRSAAP